MYISYFLCIYNITVNVIIPVSAFFLVNVFYTIVVDNINSIVHMLMFQAVARQKVETSII